MNTSTSDLAAGRNGEIAGSDAPPTPSRSTERVLWWIAFAVLTFGAVAMLGLWN